MRLLHHNAHTETIGHDGVQYERDEHGAFELPHEVAAHLLERFPHLWRVAPEPAPAEVKPRRGAKAKPEPEQPEDAAPAEETPTEEGDGGDTPSPARASSAARASSRKASA